MKGNAEKAERGALPSAEDFRRVMGHFTTGVTVVTTLDVDGKAYGVTVNSFTAVSMDPLLVLVCLDLSLSGLHHFESSGTFGVNILAEDQVETSVFFSRSGIDRSQFRYVEGVHPKIPLLQDALAWLECEVEQSHRAGDHQILIGRVLSVVSDTSSRRPLVFYRGDYAKLRSD